MPGSGYVKIVVDPRFTSWAVGFGALPQTAPAAVAPNWLQATDLMFQETQAAVHVITGALKRSGKVRIENEGQKTVGEITYGGAGVDYAEDERARGGAHDYFEQALLSVEQIYGTAMGEAIEDVIRLWR